MFKATEKNVVTMNEREKTHQRKETVRTDKTDGTNRKQMI